MNGSLYTEHFFFFIHTKPCMFTAPSQVFNTTCFNMCVGGGGGGGSGEGGGGEGRTTGVFKTDGGKENDGCKFCSI